MGFETPQEVIDYWFGNSRGTEDLDVIKQRMGLWFGRASPEFDAVQLENADLIECLIANTCDPSKWNVEVDPMAAMAKVIVLDQFSRSVHRGTGKAFAGDEICAALIRRIIEAVDADDEKSDWFFGKFSPVERFFLIVSIQHSEILSNQELGVANAGKIGYGCPNPEIGAYFSSLKGFPMEHHDVVKQFGRFPHRNELLGRESTQEEIDWLNSPECPGWAKSQQKKQ